MMETALLNALMIFDFEDVYFTREYEMEEQDGLL